MMPLNGLFRLPNQVPPDFVESASMISGIAAVFNNVSSMSEGVKSIS